MSIWDEVELIAAGDRPLLRRPEITLARALLELKERQDNPEVTSKDVTNSK